MRVVDRFRYAGNHGMSVQKSSVMLPTILSHLRAGLPIIVLTNAQRLHCYACNDRNTSIANCFTSSCKAPYQGHFVVLLGFDSQKGLIYYSNPSSSDDTCHCSYSHMEDARLSYGTDEDIIFIDSDEGCLQNSS